MSEEEAVAVETEEVAEEMVEQSELAYEPVFVTTTGGTLSNEMQTWDCTTDAVAICGPIMNHDEGVYSVEFHVDTMTSTNRNEFAGLLMHASSFGKYPPGCSGSGGLGWQAKPMGSDRSKDLYPDGKFASCRLTGDEQSMDGWNEGDVIKFEVDMFERVARFYLNGMVQPRQAHDLPSGIRFAVGRWTGQVKFTIVSLETSCLPPKAAGKLT
eukprot:m.102954 g.102954  ORF g.102954 m.102954 type:complete len:212 (+) comp15550_c1_seq2:266-901(+)